MKIEYPSRKREAGNMPLALKVEMLRKSVEEVQKYELLTTNQYLHQMELLLEVLQDITQKVNQ
jgi:hypothetical protein